MDRPPARRSEPHPEASYAWIGAVAGLLGSSDAVGAGRVGAVLKCALRLRRSVNEDNSIHTGQHAGHG
jgi:hypothetical protein